ncbi:MAG: helix-turn-helix domain-containing protein [Candidatus Limnocylindria bacterium]
MPTGAELWAELVAGSTLLTIREVAARLSCSTRTVERRIDEGSLATVNISSQGRRVTVRDLVSFIERQTEEAASE